MTFRDIGRVLVSFALAAPIVLLILAEPASADWTTRVCDSAPKYWCKQVKYTPGGSTIEINERWHEGGRGGVGTGTQWWQRWITQDWRYDQPTNTWYFQTGWAPGPERPNTSLDTWDPIISTRTYGHQAVARLQNRYYECIPNECYHWCSPFTDFKVSIGTYSEGPRGCLSPVY